MQASGNYTPFLIKIMSKVIIPIPLRKFTNRKATVECNNAKMLSYDNLKTL